MNYIENLGLEFLTDTKEAAMALCNAVCAEGRAIVGYYEYPYINHEFGWPQFIFRTRPRSKGKENEVEVSGMDVHLSGVTYWNFEIIQSYKACEDGDVLTRKVLARRIDGWSSTAMITLINADVLPSFGSRDKITAQVVGFPVDIHYYEDEDAYAKDQPNTFDGKKLYIPDKSVVPIGLLTNKEKVTPEEENLTLVRGTVKRAEWGLVEFGDEKGWNFLDVIITTEFGDLEIVHTEEQIPEEERKFIKEGCVVNGLFMISGDVALKKYEKGYVKDFEHNLALLRYTLEEGEQERLASVLAENAEYESEWAKATYRGKKEIVDRLKYVRDSNPDTRYIPLFATICDVDEGDEELPYGVGDRCIVIALDNECDYDAICFMECDEENNISKITVTRNPRYHFDIDEEHGFKMGDFS